MFLFVSGVGLHVMYMPIHRPHIVAVRVCKVINTTEHLYLFVFRQQRCIVVKYPGANTLSRSPDNNDEKLIISV